MADTSTDRGLAPGGSMSLLVDMTTGALDPAYAEAAARRSARGEPVSGGRHRAALALLVAAGLATGVAAAQVRARAHEAGDVRRSLAADVRSRTRSTDALEQQAARLRAQVTRTRAAALGAGERGQAAAARVSALELATGATPVHGPGLVVTLDDAPDAGVSSPDARGGQPGDGRVYDRDVQDVVNALWLAGAEAMSINGQRLTAQTAIRSAGEAVLVDFRPLAPPYVVKAVGDVDAMEPAFADGPTARRFQTWTSLYGIGFDVTRGKDLRLPAAGTPDLRLARPGGPS